MVSLLGAVVDNGRATQRIGILRGASRRVAEHRTTFIVICRVLILRRSTFVAVANAAALVATNDETQAE